MGHKIHPRGLRIGILETWDSRWFMQTNYAQTLDEDNRIRKYLKERLYTSGVSRILIERRGNRLWITILSARPGLIIGKKGQEVERLRDELRMYTDKESHLNIQEVKRPETDAQLIAENVALQLERRVSYRRAMKRAMANAMRFGAQGCKIACAGRLQGAEIARTEWYKEGRIPLQTLRASIDYGFAESKTKYGVIGVKVWIFKGEVLEQPMMRGNVHA